MAFERYVAEEIATEAAEGIIPRREALRRLGLLGLSLPAAAGLLTAFGVGGKYGDGYGDDDGPEVASAAGDPAGLAGPPVVSGQVAAGPPAEIVTFISSRGPTLGAAPDGASLTAAFAAAAGPGPAKGSVLVIHENKGLTDHFRAFPLRLAADGYNTLALDLLSRDGGTASFADPAAATAALTAAPKERLVADARAGIDELLRRDGSAKVGMMGFCFGGGMTWSVLAAGEARLAAAIPFYGPLPEPAALTGARAAVLAVYAELDSRVNASRDAAAAALTAAGLTHEIKTYPGVDHAFFNETGPRYNAAAATDAYQAVLAWYGRHLAAPASLPVTG